MGGVCRRGYGHVLVAGALIALLLVRNAALADDDEAPGKAASNPYFELDTKNLFGFLEGADIGEKGDRSIEMETTGSFILRQGRYASIEQEVIYETTPAQRLGVEFGGHFLGQSVTDIGQAPNYVGVGFSGLSLELRYLTIPRSEEWPFQLTLTAEPEWTRISDFGQNIVEGSIAFRAVADAKFLDDRLYGAVNLLYAPDDAREPGQDWRSSSTLGASGAVSYRISPNGMFGGEADYFRDYDGLAAQSLQGEAFYVGPTFHYQFNEKVDLSGGYLDQIAGHAIGERHGLDLTNFPSRQAKLRLEIQF